MPELPFEPPPLTNLRERLAEQAIARARSAEKKLREALSLQASSGRAMSPLEEYLYAQKLDYLRSIKVDLRRNLQIAKQQTAAERKTQAKLRKLSPLERSRNRQGFWRTEGARNAAIEGILERERRQNAPLTRDAYARAEAIAASRRLFDPEVSSLRGSRGYEYVVRPSELVTFDPCVEYLAAQYRRRQVLFAKKLNRGYHSPHRWNPC